MKRLFIIASLILLALSAWAQSLTDKDMRQRVGHSIADARHLIEEAWTSRGHLQDIHGALDMRGGDTPALVPASARPAAPGGWSKLTPANLRDVPGWPTRADMPRGLDGKVYENGGIQADRCIMTCYNGAFHVPQGAPKYPNGAMCFHGGGHSHGTSVGIYCLAFGETPKIVQEAPEFVYDTEVPGTAGYSYFQPSKSPASGHIYGSPLYVDGDFYVQPEFTFTPVGMPGIAQKRTVNYWEWDGKKWIKHSPRIHLWTSGVYDPKAGLIYMSGNVSDYMTFDPKTNKAVQVGRLFYDRSENNSDQALVYDPDDDLIWALSHGKLYQVILSEDGIPMLVGSPVDVPGYDRGNAGLEYHARSLWLWMGTRKVLQFNIETGEWSTHSPAKGPACISGSLNIFSKFMWSEYYGAFVAACDSIRPVYLFRPEQSRPSKPPRPAPIQNELSQIELFQEEVSQEEVSQDDPSRDSPPRAPDEVTWARDPFTYGGLPRFQVTSFSPGHIPLSGRGGLPQNLHQTGDQLYIGIVTEWQAQLLAGKTEYYPDVMYQGGLDIYGPDFTEDFAHTPGIYWVPYLLTGEETYIASMEKQYDRYQAWKRTDFTRTPGDYISLGRNTGWQLRNLGELAKVKPEVYKPVLDGLRDVLLAKIAAGDTYLTLPDQDGYIFWEEAMAAQGMAHIVALGNPDWLPILNHQIDMFRLYDVKDWDSYFGIHWTGDPQADRAAFEKAHGLDTVPDGTLAQDHPNSKNIRAFQVLTAFGMAAKAGADSCDLYTRYRALIEPRIGSWKVPARTNPVVHC